MLVSDWKDDELPSRDPVSTESTNPEAAAQTNTLELPQGPRRERAASVGGFSHVIVSRIGVHGRKQPTRRPSFLVQQCVSRLLWLIALQKFNKDTPAIQASPAGAEITVVKSDTLAVPIETEVDCPCLFTLQRLLLCSRRVLARLRPATHSRLQPSRHQRAFPCYQCRQVSCFVMSARVNVAAGALAHIQLRPRGSSGASPSKRTRALVLLS